jgi:hypothetical protein
MRMSRIVSKMRVGYTNNLDSLALPERASNKTRRSGEISQAAKRKRGRRRSSDDGPPITGFSSPMDHLATLTLNIAGRRKRTTPVVLSIAKDPRTALLPHYNRCRKPSSLLHDEVQCCELSIPTKVLIMRMRSLRN